MSMTKWLLAAAFVAVAAPAFAADHTVQMLNTGSDGSKMVFEPALTKIAVGDTVTFVATDKGHNAESIKDMLPAGAEPFKGNMGQNITVTFTVPGAYGVRCLPHYGMGMVGLVVVGDVPPANLDAVKALKNPPAAQKRLDGLFAQVAAAQ